MRAGASALALAFGVAALGIPAPARAAPPWVERRLTLLDGEWAFDVGLGVGHVPDPVATDTSAGMNLEAAVGLTPRIELGVRTGVRFGDGPARSIEPDLYGRLFDRQYFGGGAAVLANPELRLRGALVEGSVGELGLEGRFILPFEDGTHLGVEPGLPLALHLGENVRLDTGLWLPVTVGDRVAVGASVPFDLWIQATPRVWLGPMTGLTNYDLGSNQSQTLVAMGLGVGVQLARAVDFKTMFLFPEINQETRVFGLGAGVQFRLE